MSDFSYVRTEMLPEQQPPLTEVGIVGWARANLFNGVVNSVLTVLSVTFLAYVVWHLSLWAFRSSWTANSLSECREQIALAYGDGVHGACWAVIRDRFLQLMYGFYPREEYWRINLSFVLMLVALLPVLFMAVPRKLLWFSAIYPALAFWLLWGGSIWGPLLIVAGFFVAGFVGMYVTNIKGALFGIIVGVLVWLFWMIFVVSSVSGGITASIAEGRYQSILTESAAVLDDSNATEQALKDAKSDADSVNRVMALKESLPAAKARAAELRAALPDTVASIYDTDDITSSMDENDVVLLREAISAESDVVSAESAIGQIDENIGLFGLKPVESAKFGGFAISVIIGVAGIVGSLPIGIVLALGRQSDLIIVKGICVGFIEFIRGVPLITLLFVASTLLNYFLPPGTTFDIILRVVIMVTLFASAYMAEVVRGGLAALPKGQYEAADSLGLDYWKAQRLIIMPQALKISIPGIVSSFIGLFKDTTLVSIIGILDPLGLSNAIRADAAWNGIYWELFAFIALLFFVFCFSMSRYSMYLERKLNTGHR